MGRLSDRMEEDLLLAGMSTNTRTVYLRCARAFAAHYMRCPSVLGFEDVRAYLLHLRVKRGLAPASLNVHSAALRFLYVRTLRRPDAVEGLHGCRKHRNPPLVPTTEEVHALLDAARTPFYRAIFTAMYDGGLRISEACRLRVEDIDSRMGLLHVRKAKGDKDRSVMLGATLLAVLRDHWRRYRPPGPWLFPSRGSGRRHWLDQPITTRSVSREFGKARAEAALRRHFTPHSLRHAFATHLLEAGVEMTVLRSMMGHVRLDTTAHYALVRSNLIRTIPSPLDLKPPPAP